jgi:addiction module HigA family antidote
MQPANPIHPGEMLLEGKRGVTAAAALDLAEVLGTSPRLWMNLQATYDLDEAARKRRAA